ncbi:MAG TPA: urate hydroxylase PuuD [Polyangia bacterium]|nr:urate hydroxylase PuuD [Polyangia bacterium]
MDALFSMATAALFVRWAHVIFGVLWLGHLYFFNLVNVPFQGDLDKDLKAKVNPKLLLRALYWFRWSAMYTVILGLVLFGWHYMGPEKLMHSPDGKMSGRAMWIQYGMLLGLIMWFNVWFVIWPRQKKILGGVLSGTPHPDTAKLAATAGKASRFNTFASGPLLFAMLGAPHFGAMSAPVLIGVTVIGVGFWFGMIKRSFKIRTDAV